MKTALIVDPDIGFGFWLGRGLDQSHYQSFPAKSVVDATALLDELRLQVDLLILNPALPDTAKLIESLRRSNDELRVVALIGDQPRLPEIAARVDLCCRKPDRSEVKRLEWIGHVEELLPASLFGATFKNSALLRKCAGTLVRYARHRDGGLDDSRRLDSAVAPSWPDWEGHIVQNEYRLERYLGSSEQSAVFLTRCGDGAQQAAAIKVVLADSADREILLPRWERAAALSHPGLVRLFDMGNCESCGTALLYLVMEYAEDNLAELLRQRPLTPDEAREMLELVLNTLDYIHSRGLVHGHLRPSNILGVADQLKITSDGLRPASEGVPASANRSVHDPPESAAGIISPAGDIWSLGITLIEALTQRPPLPRRSPRKPPVLPGSVPPLYLDLARQCLQPDPVAAANRGRLDGAVAQAAAHRRGAATSHATAVAPDLALCGAGSTFWHWPVSGVLLRPLYQIPVLVLPPPALSGLTKPAPHDRTAGVPCVRAPAAASACSARSTHNAATSPASHSQGPSRCVPKGERHNSRHAGGPRPSTRQFCWKCAGRHP